MYPSDLLGALIAGLRITNVGYAKAYAVWFRAFYDQGMDPIWILVYDVEYEPTQERTEVRHERRMAMGQGSRLHMDSIAEHMKGW